MHSLNFLLYFAVFNVVPWLSTIPGIICGGFLTKKLLADGVTVAKTRKIVEGICMITEAICLLLIGKIQLFEIILMPNTFFYNIIRLMCHRIS
jgi:hypothetical protein